MSLYQQVRIIDPRVENSCTKTANSHQSIKDSRAVWLGDQQRILTTGFDAARLRQVIIRDLRNFNEPEKTLELDCSTGILIPLYDADTSMLFLAGKGRYTLRYELLVLYRTRLVLHSQSHLWCKRCNAPGRCRAQGLHRANKNYILYFLSWYEECSHMSENESKTSLLPLGEKSLALFLDCDMFAPTFWKLMYVIFEEGFWLVFSFSQYIILEFQ